MAMSEVGRRIREEVDSIRLVDTHEHIEPEVDRLGVDFFGWFPHYASSDLISAGMPARVMQEVRDPSRPAEERWAKLAPHWRNMRNTAYGRVLLLAARGLFGVEDINDDTWQVLNEKVARANRPGWYRYVLKEQAGIAISIEDFQTTDVDRDLFAPVMRFDDFITVSSRRELRALEHRTDVAVHSLDDLLKALDAAFEKATEAGIVGVKNALAYYRILRYDKVTHHEAEMVFNRISSHVDELREETRPGPSLGIGWQESKPLQDYMMHQVIRRAIDRGLPIQIHTGLQEGTSNFVTNSNPTLLANLLVEYPQARFDLFHAGYPYPSEMATLGKNFANVYVDMCWLHAISPAVSRRVLDEWLETVPANKILAFGGDYRFPEGAYGHSVLARQVVSQVLTSKVEEGYLSEAEALEIARKILHDNAAQLFGLAV